MIAIIQYGAGNIGSVQNALDRLGYDHMVTDDDAVIRSADKVILPGVGQARSAMKQLESRGLVEVIPYLKQPLLGICLGLQLLCRYSEEGDVQCLNVFDSDVKRFPEGYIVPHMGWNTLSGIKGAMFKGVNANISNVYFVHSYYAELCDATVADCEYIIPFSAAMQKNNFYATQFHPEKSGVVGEQILKNFLAL